MLKEWYTIAELIELGLPGLKGSYSTLHRKAKVEEWKGRQRGGIRGTAYEYHVSSLPSKAQEALGLTGDMISESDATDGLRSEHTAAPNQLLPYFCGLTKQETENLATLFSRKGIELVLALLDEDNLRFIQMDGERKALLLELTAPMEKEELRQLSRGALKLACMLSGLPDKERREILLGYGIEERDVTVPRHQHTQPKKAS